MTALYDDTCHACGTPLVGVGILCALCFAAEENVVPFPTSAIPRPPLSDVAAAPPEGGGRGIGGVESGASQPGRASARRRTSTPSIRDTTPGGIRGSVGEQPPTGGTARPGDGRTGEG